MDRKGEICGWQAQRCQPPEILKSGEFYSFVLINASHCGCFYFLFLQNIMKKDYVDAKEDEVLPKIWLARFPKIERH